MQQEFLFLADKAEAINGKLYVIGGGVDVHRATKFPVNMLTDVAASFLVDWGETNREIDVIISIVDEDERLESQIGIKATVGPPTQAKQGQSIRSIIALRGPFGISKPGAYKVFMELDGVRQEPPFRFWVEQVPMPAMPSGRSAGTT